jgi:hypothetical protein
MNVAGATPYPVGRWNGQVDYDNPTKLPNGVAILCKNMKFKPDSVATRFGTRHSMQYAQLIGGDASGLDVLEVVSNASATPPVVGRNIPIVYNTDGTLLIESPEGSGTLVSLVTPIVLPSGEIVMQMAKAYGRAYLACSDLNSSVTPPLLLDGPSGKVYPGTQNPMGAPWNPGTYYFLGDLVRTASGAWFRCITAGIAAGEPTWPTNYGFFYNTINDYQSSTVKDAGGVTEWEEWTPVFVTSLNMPNLGSAKIVRQPNDPGGSPIAGGLDIYVMASYSSGIFGETSPTGPLVFVNTTAGANYQVNFQPVGNLAGGPSMPHWMAAIESGDGQFVGFFMNIYVAAVATGSPAPPLTNYELYSSSLPVAPIVINSFPSGTRGPEEGICYIPLKSDEIQVQEVIGHDSHGKPRLITVTTQIQPVFYGSTGKRYAVLTREGIDGSYAPIDPASAIPLFIQSEITTIPLTAGSLVTGNQFTVIFADGTGLQTGMTAHCAGMPYPQMNGNFQIASVFPVTTGDDASSTAFFVTFNAPGIPTDLPSVDASSAIITVQGQVAPVAIIPPADPSSGIQEYIVGLTVAGAPVAGPYFFIDQPDPAASVTVQILNISSTQGVVEVEVSDGSAFSVGSRVLAAGVDPLNGYGLIGSVVNNIITYAQTFPDTAQLTPVDGTLQLIQQLPTAALPVGNDAPALVLNYSDDYLADAVDNDITFLLTAMAVPPAVDLYFSPSLQQLCICGADGYKVSVVFSIQQMFGTVDASGGILPVESNNGGQVVCVREMRNQQVIAFKTNGGYGIVPSDQSPSLWGLTRLWDTHGPHDARCVGMGTEFCVFGCQDGAFLWDGTNKMHISKEIKKSWERINWEASQPMWICVDELEHEIHFGVATGTADTPSEEWVCNYFNGWDEPIRETLTGDVIVNRHARKWDVGGLRAARTAIIAKRNLAYDPNVGGDEPDIRIAQRQFLYGNSFRLTSNLIVEVADAIIPPPDPLPNYNTHGVNVGTWVRVARVVAGQIRDATDPFGNFQVGLVGFVTPQSYDTFKVTLPGAGYADQWYILWGPSPNQMTQMAILPGSATEFVFTADGQSPAQITGPFVIDQIYPDVYDDAGLGIDSQYEPALADGKGSILRFRGVSGQMTGSGLITMTPCNEDGPLGLEPAMIILPGDGTTTHYARGIVYSGEHLQYLYSNGASPGSFFELHEENIWFAPLFAVRKFQ